MNPFRLLIPPTIAASLAASIVAAPALAATDPAMRQGGVAYTSGGISEEDRETLDATAKAFNLKLVLATKGGAYLSDVGVVVNDDRGQRIIDAKSDGPWFYAKLPSGRYSIEASANGTVVRKAVTLGPQLSRVDFRWDD